MIATGHRDYSDLTQIFYYPEDNVYVDTDGKVVDFIFEYVEPNDIFLFKLDPGFCMFQHRFDPEWLIELIYCFDESYKNIEKENFYEQRRRNRYTRGCGERGCQFFDNSEASKREICSICRGGD